jgi:phosphohistidine phosphatase
MEAAAAADTIVAAGFTIDEVLVSLAQRTRETARIVTSKLVLPVSVRALPELYLAAPDVLLQAVQNCRPHSHTVLLIAHNPGLSELAYQLTGGTDGIALRTGGLCSLQFARQSWDQIGTVHASGCAILR